MNSSNSGICTRRQGYLALYMGCMRADKSLLAIRKATRFADLGEKVLYIRSSKDLNRETEGGDRESFTSHNSSNKYLSSKVDKVTCDDLSDVGVDKYNVIVIDEAQFFDDIFITVLTWVDVKNKYVIAVGIDSTYKRTMFSSLINLIPHADHYEKMKAKCVKCAEEHTGEGIVGKYVDAIFTMLDKDIIKRSNNTHVEDCPLIPGNEGYIPVCRYHYNLYNPEFVLKRL